MLADLLLEAFEAAGADEGVIYVSVPITSGVRELRLMRKLGCTREALQQDPNHREAWLELVVRPNERDARVHAARVRALFPRLLVVEPARLHVKDWDSSAYDDFWKKLIQRYALRVVVTPEWAFSRDARLEVNAAIRARLPIIDLDGAELPYGALAAHDQAARAAMANDGWTADEIAGYLPPLSLEEPPDGVAEQADDAAVVDRASAEVFSWLRGERAYQVVKFGPDQDDRHTREGLGYDGWWWRQLTNYYHRALVLGLETPVGRQALAKFVATACGLLESAVRQYGTLPPPGVPSGQNIDVGRPRAE